MPAYFEQGFFVRKPAWHELGVVLQDYPGREEAMKLAGHDFAIVERPIVVVGKERGPDEPAPLTIDGKGYGAKRADGWKALVHNKTGAILNVTRESYGVVQNEVGWDIVDAIVNQPNVRYETGLTLKEGAVCSVLAWLDEPVQIPGDDSPILPFVNVSWTHDGSGAVQARSTSIRTVCWNTQSAAELEGKRLGTEFTFRHTKNVMQRIEDAKMAIRGIRAQHEEYVELARELATTPITTEQRELFVSQFLPLPPEALISDRVAKNVEEARAAVRGILRGPTVPEAHRFTAYGLQLAGVEYLDHLRGYRNRETLFGRQLLRNEPAKGKLVKLIREVAAA